MAFQLVVTCAVGIATFFFRFVQILYTTPAHYLLKYNGRLPLLYP